MTIRVWRVSTTHDVENSTLFCDMEDALAYVRGVVSVNGFKSEAAKVTMESEMMEEFEYLAAVNEQDGAEVDK